MMEEIKFNFDTQKLKKSASEISSVSQNDLTVKKCENLIAEIQKFAELCGWTDQMKLWVLLSKLGGGLTGLLDINFNESWKGAKSILRQTYGLDFDKLSDMLESFNRPPNEAILEAIIRLFKILNHEELQFKNHPIQWRQRIIRQK